MAKTSIGPLARRLDAMITQLEKEQGQQEIVFQCYWGDEEIEDDGSPIFVTEWGGGKLDDEDIEARHKYYEEEDE